jgi:hypothetical protein
VFGSLADEASLGKGAEEDGLPTGWVFMGRHGGSSFIGTRFMGHADERRKQADER